LIEWELTEKKGGGLGKSPQGHFTGGPEDYPKECEEDIAEATSEVPSSE